MTEMTDFSDELRVGKYVQLPWELIVQVESSALGLFQGQSVTLVNSVTHRAQLGTQTRDRRFPVI